MLRHNTDELISLRLGLPSAAALKAIFPICKPSIVGLSLVAALTGMYIASRGAFVGWGVVGWTFLTLGLATAGACILNNVYDRDIDSLMGRTRKRALVSGAVSPRLALFLGLALAIVPIFVMWITVNAPSAVLTAAAVFGYVVVYTIWTKRRTPWANQLGGIAGALPPVIGYVAVSGQVDIYATFMFVFMAVWQQPHSLSLALKYRGDYARAGVPVVPVAKGVAATKLRIALYTAMLLPISLVPYLFGLTGIVYLAVALVMGLIFVAKAIGFLRSERDYNIKLFVFSNIYLMFVFSAMVWDIERAALTG